MLRYRTVLIDSHVVAILAFKTAVTFELTRRQNDKRIIALQIDMKDLMSVVAMEVSLFVRSLPGLTDFRTGCATWPKVIGEMMALPSKIDYGIA